MRHGNNHDSLGLAREFVARESNLDSVHAIIRLHVIMSSPPSRAASIFALLGFVIVTFSAAFVGVLASLSSAEMYATMIKPTWSPPGWLFGRVWTVLYCLMAVAVWLVWRKRAEMRVDIAWGTYLVHLIFQAAWSWLFFGLGRADAAMFDIMVLWLMIVWLMLAFWRIDRLAGLLMLPYLLWVSFASVLNGALWLLNGGILPR